MNDIEGWLTPHEGQMLEKAVTSLHHVSGAIVEIGSYLGKSTVLLAKSKEIVYAIDPHKGEFSGGKTKPTKRVFLENIRRAGVASYIKPIIKTSKDAHRFWKLPIKLLFIDGLHDEKHAMEDYDLWAPYLMSGGVIAMHDAFCGWDGAGRVAMQHIVYNPQFGEIGVVGSIIYGIRKKTGYSGWILKLFRQCVIELCHGIYKINILPNRIQFILVHKLLRVLLINRFTSLA